MGFEPTCPSLDKTISSRSRYDHFDTSPYLIFKHRLARYLEKCKISMQDNKGKFRCAPEEKPVVKPFLADKLTKGRESFESCAEKDFPEKGRSELVSSSPDFRRCQAVFKEPTLEKWLWYESNRHPPFWPRLARFFGKMQDFMQDN